MSRVNRPRSLSTLVACILTTLVVSQESLSITSESSMIPSFLIQKSYCNAHDSPQSPPNESPPKATDSQQNICDVYNNFFERAKLTGRMNRCNSTPGCIFVGSSPFKGTCVSRDPASIVQAALEDLDNMNDRQVLHFPRKKMETKEEPKSNDIEAIMRTKDIYAEIIGDYTVDGKIKPIKVILTDQIAAQAVSSMKDSHLLANELARELIIEVLNNPENHGKFGEILQHTFKTETMQKSIQWVFTWTLNNDYTKQYATQLSRNQIKYLTHLHKMRNHGYKTEQIPLNLLVNNLNWWFSLEATKTNFFLPYIKWALKQEDMVIEPLSEVVAASGPYLKDATVEGIVYYATDYLKSDEFRQTAKEGIIGFFHKIAADKQSESKSTNSTDDKRS